MTELGQIYKCNICGNVVEVLNPGKGQLLCCRQPMELLQAKTRHEGKEKHVPVVERTRTGVKVKVGSIPHPMDQEHYIEFIEATSETGTICKVFLSPGMKPEAEFPFTPVSAREYCNLHGLWKTEK